jgi:hypothetical protein
MPSRIVTRVTITLTVTLVAEISGFVLDKVGISEDRSRLTRALMISSISTICGVLLGTALHKPDEKTTEELEQVWARPEQI